MALLTDAQVEASLSALSGWTRDGDGIRNGRDRYPYNPRRS